MEALKELFGTQNAVEVIYWLLGLGATGFLLLRSLINAIGIELDHDLDWDIAGHDVSTASIVAFLAISGWTGVLGYRITELSTPMVSLLAFGSGIVGFVSSVWMLGKLKGLESSGTLDINNAIGKTGTVYLGIPAEGQGNGQVQIVLQGRQVIIDAKTVGQQITTGSKVLVYALDNDRKLLVERLDEEL